MRHLVTYAQDGHIELAYVEDDSGELTQIGRFIWPEGYGLTEAAMLGTNLTAFLQLNGHKPRKRATTPPVAVERPKPEALGPSTSEAQAVAPSGARRRGRPPGSQGTAGRRYISLEEIVAVIKTHPGSRCSEIATHLSGGETVAWATKAVANRLQAQRDQPDSPVVAEKHSGKRGPYYLYWPAKA